MDAESTKNQTEKTDGETAQLSYVSTEVAAPIPLDNNMVVLAKDPYEMQASQAKLTSWFRQRVELAKYELAEAEANLEHARIRKWAISGWVRQANLAKGRVVFYEKCCAALEEGYCIVPDFPVDIFAVRTTKRKPKRNEISTNSWRAAVADQQASYSPIGKGEYVSPIATEGIHIEEDLSGERTSRKTTTTWAEAFKPPDFPMKRVRPQILDATGRAMALKLFDEIGVLPASRARRSRDPIVTGRVVRKEGLADIALSFLICWWVDTREL